MEILYFVVSGVLVVILAWLFHCWQQLYHFEHLARRRWEEVISLMRKRDDVIPRVLEALKMQEAISDFLFHSIVEIRAVVMKRTIIHPRLIGRNEKKLFDFWEKVRARAQKDPRLQDVSKVFSQIEMVFGQYNHSVHFFNAKLHRPSYFLTKKLFRYQELSPFELSSFSPSSPIINR